MRHERRRCPAAVRSGTDANIKTAPARVTLWGRQPWRFSSGRAEELGRKQLTYVARPLFVPNGKAPTLRAGAFRHGASGQLKRSTATERHTAENGSNFATRYALGKDQFLDAPWSSPLNPLEAGEFAGFCLASFRTLTITCITVITRIAPAATFSQAKTIAVAPPRLPKRGTNACTD